MNAAAYADWVELQHLMKERYPDLPFHEAHLNLLHDAFIKLPEEYRKRIAPMLPHLVQQSPEILGAIGNFIGNPGMVFFSQVAGFIRNITMANNTDTRPLVFDEATSDSVRRSAEAVAASARVAAENMQRAADSADRVVREVHQIHVIGKSLVDRIDYYRRWTQTASAIQIAQGNKAIRILTEISDHLGESNSIAVSGSGGPDGFAQHVYDFIREEINNIDESEADKHRFFVYHPDTNWYGAFRRLIREDPLPPTFCAKSDNLDTLCQYMQGVRAQCRKDVVLHLLIPAWSHISIKEPLHFPDGLQPFQVKGRKHKGKPYVEFNLPAAPAGLLHGVANNVPNSICSPATASTVSAVVTAPAVGWGVNGVCLALGVGIGTITGAGMLVGVPIWIATGMPAMSIAAPVIEKTVYGALCEEAPRILGSNRRLYRSP